MSSARICLFFLSKDAGCRTALNKHDKSAFDFMKHEVRNFINQTHAHYFFAKYFLAEQLSTEAPSTALATADTTCLSRGSGIM